jgi:tellurium resistance protein TerD
MLSIDLTKGQRVDVGLRRAGVGLGWNPNSQASAAPFDLYASAFMLGENGKIPGGDFFVFYNHLLSADGAVRSSGDNLDGEGDGDDETLFVDLTSVDPRIQEIVITVTLHDAEERRQNFGQVREAYIRLYDQDSGQEICKYELDEDFSTESAVTFGRLYRRNGAWKFEAVGTGHHGGLQGLLNQFS